MQEREKIIRDFVAAANTNDVVVMTELLSSTLVASVTNASAGVDVVYGRDAYLARLPDFASADYSLTVPDVVEVDDDLVLAMVVVVAERNGKSLRNYSGQLARITDGRITHLWMVDALPEESDDFWS